VRYVGTRGDWYTKKLGLMSTLFFDPSTLSLGNGLEKWRLSTWCPITSWGRFRVHNSQRSNFLNWTRQKPLLWECLSF